MTVGTVFVTAVLAMASGVISKPIQLLGTEQMSAVDVRVLTTNVDQAMLAAFACTGQSCLIADTAGSTGRIPVMKAEGASEGDIKCIISYNPEVGELLTRYKNNPPLAPKQNTTWLSTALGGLNSIVPATKQVKGTFTGQCTPNILIFAKGTLEPTQYGITIGPQITKNLPAGWSAAPVDYSPDIAGDYCLGLPGGAVATDVINLAAKKCPASQLFLSGYSQGAMVIRNGLARADPSAQSKVKGVVTFGDPFNGALIKGYNGPIAIFCKPGDGVCTGNFEVGTAHLAYVNDNSVKEAQQTLIAMSQGKGDTSCCSPRPIVAPPSSAQWETTIKANGGRIPLAKPGVTVEEWEAALIGSDGKVPTLAAVPKASKGRGRGRLVLVE